MKKTALRKTVFAILTLLMLIGIGFVPPEVLGRPDCTLEYQSGHPGCNGGQGGCGGVVYCDGEYVDFFCANPCHCTGGTCY